MLLDIVGVIKTEPIRITELRQRLEASERRVEELRGRAEGEYSRRLEAMRVEQGGCERELRSRDAAVDTAEAAAAVLRRYTNAECSIDYRILRTNI